MELKYNKIYVLFLIIFENVIHKKIVFIKEKR